MEKSIESRLEFKLQTSIKIGYIKYERKYITKQISLQ